MNKILALKMNCLLMLNRPSLRNEKWISEIESLFSLIRNINPNHFSCSIFFSFREQENFSIHISTTYRFHCISRLGMPLSYKNFWKSDLKNSLLLITSKYFKSPPHIQPFSQDLHGIVWSVSWKRSKLSQYKKISSHFHYSNGPLRYLP